jgi:hypothetical protein
MEDLRVCVAPLGRKKENRPLGERPVRESLRRAGSARLQCRSRFSGSGRRRFGAQMFAQQHAAAARHGHSHAHLHAQATAHALESASVGRVAANV